MCECDQRHFVIYKGDDTDFMEDQYLVIQLSTDIDLEGATATFSFLGFSQEIYPIPSDKTLKITIPHSVTAKFPVGFADATVTITKSNNKIRTATNSIPIKVTQSVDEAYNPSDPNAISVTISNGQEEVLTQKYDNRYLVKIGGGTQQIFSNIELSANLSCESGSVIDGDTINVGKTLTVRDWNSFKLSTNEETIKDMVGGMIDDAIGPLSAALEERIGASVEKSAFAAFDGIEAPSASLSSLKGAVAGILAILKGMKS